MANISVISFNAGELSPQIDARSDVAKYSSGCRTLNNFIPRIYGSAERRPGTKYIDSVKNDSEKSRLVSFQYSDTIAYIIEFGPEYIRFFYDGARLTGASSANWSHYGIYKQGELITYSNTLYRCLVASGYKDKIVSHWNLNDNTAETRVIDSVGGINGTATAATSTLSNAGAPGLTDGRCFDFNGTYAVEIDDNAKHSFGDGTNDEPFSLSAFVYVTATAGIQTIMSKYDTSNKREWFFDINADEKLDFVLYDESATAWARRLSSNALTAGWHWVQGTYDGGGGSSAASGMKLYVDGALVSSAASYSNTYTAMENLTANAVIGAQYSAGTLTYYWQDKVDNVAIFKKELTGAEITAICNTPPDNPTDWTAATLSSGRGICETPSPYAESDLFELQFRQSADVMWIVHPDYAPRKLSRTSAYTFDLSTIDFTNGPFLPRNDLENNDGITLTPSATTGNITLTASDAVFDPDHISLPGALFKITQPRATTETSGTSTHPTTGVIGSAIDVKGTFTFNTHGTWTKTIKLQRNENEEGWETYRTFISTNDRNIQFTGTETADNVQYRINVTSSTSGTVNADLTVNNSTQDGICRIDTYISPTVVTATVLTDFASTNASLRWYEGAWSAHRGYPSAFTFFGERGVYAGTTYQPQMVWLSASGDFEDFEEGTNDDDSFSIPIASDEMNAIRWLSALEALVFGTIGGEWRIRATALDEELTPTNFNVRQQSTYGSKKIQPIPVGAAVLFVDYVGRKVREMTFSDEKQKFVAPDLSALAEHITLTGITSFAYQRNPDSILWCTLTDGSLLSMTYEREQDVVAWSKHPLGGTSAVAESVAVISGTSEDEIWITVSRTVDGSTVRHIEQLQPRVSVDFEDAFFVDSGLVFDGGDAIDITNVTQADPGVVTATAHGFSDGDQVYIADITGMTELNGNYYTIGNVTTNTFELRSFVETSSSPSSSISASVSSSPSSSISASPSS